MTTLTVLIAEAIAHFEGFYLTPDTLAKKNNNPGNMRNWDKNLPKGKGGYDIFPTPEAGWRALHRQITKNIIRNLTLEEFFKGKEGVYAGYAPASDNNPVEAYVNFVTAFLNERGIKAEKTSLLSDLDNT